MTAVFVYITVSGRDEALAIGRILVEERLAACVNVLGPMTSVYWWQGKTETANEAVLIAKTRQALLPALTDRVRALHSYACPCVVAWPLLEAGNPQYLEWIETETREPPSDVSL
jgi:periplasmic divalent cation tolerance protein